MLLLEYFLFSGGTLGLLLTISLFNKKENIAANRMLGITLLAYSLDIFYALYTVAKLYLKYPGFIGTSGLLPFIYSPALYLYTHLISENKKHFNLKYLYHFLPAVLMLFSGLVLFFIFSEEVRLSLMDPYLKKSTFIIIMRTIIPFYGITYLLFSLSEIKKYHHRLKENFSNIEKLKLDWLIYLIVGIALVWLLELVQIILIDIIGKPENIAYKYIYVAVSILIYLITYKSLNRPEIFAGVELKEKEFDEEPSVKKIGAPPYIKSGLTEIKARRIIERLLIIMENEKPYLKSNLSLSDLSLSLGISSHNLSEAINTKLNKSFYDFINYYRIEEVKKMLKDEKYSSSPVLSIAFEAGFNSKTAFNTIFKKITGVTPTEFRRKD
jgi:AraC-like DNA-binding protein